MPGPHKPSTKALTYLLTYSRSWQPADFDRWVTPPSAESVIVTNVAGLQGTHRYIHNRPTSTPIPMAPPPIPPQYTDAHCKCVLVTGGVGFVGSHIAEALLSEGREVIVYDVFNSETTMSAEKQENAAILQRTAEQHAGKGAKLSIIDGDIRDQENLIKVINSKGVTGCIHVGGMVDDRRSVLVPHEYFEVNIFGTCQLLDALGKCGVKMVVQASTRSVFGQRVDNEESLYESPAKHTKHEAGNKPNGTRQVCVMLRLETAPASLRVLKSLLR